MDDALMAPVNHNHFDGYVQGPSTLTKYKPGEHVPGLLLPLPSLTNYVLLNVRPVCRAPP